jgi:hypothetical protein
MFEAQAIVNRFLKEAERSSLRSLSRTGQWSGSRGRGDSFGSR